MATQRNQTRRGNYSMFMGVMVVGLLGFGALGVDISYISMANMQAQAVADAASHAALVGYRSSNGFQLTDRVADGHQAAQWIVDHNNVGIQATGDLAFVQLGIYNPTTGNFTAGALPYNAARAQVERANSNPLELFLAPIMGMSNTDVSEFGITSANPREIVVAVDRSCSMGPEAAFTANHTVSPGYLGVGASLVAFSTYMVDHQVPLDRLGVTTFNHSSDVWDPIRYVNGDEGSILAKWASWSSWGSPFEVHWWYDYDGNHSWLWDPTYGPWIWNTEAPGWMSHDGGTDQGPAITLAVNELTSTGSPLAFKAIIVVSDGNPTSGTGKPGFLAATEDAWANDIHVWTVGFGGSIDDALMEEATKGVGTYYPLPDSDHLDDVMLDIARSIPVTVVQ